MNRQDNYIKSNNEITQHNLNQHIINSNSNPSQMNMIPSQINFPTDNQFNPIENQVDPNETLLLINKTLRINIKLSLAIYKQLNNFNNNNIDELFKQTSKTAK